MLFFLHGPRCSEPDGRNELTHEKVNKFNGISMTQTLAYAEVQFAKATALQTILATTDDAENGCILKVRFNIT